MKTEYKSGYQSISRSGCRTPGFQDIRQDCHVSAGYSDRPVSCIRIPWSPAILLLFLCLLAVAGCQNTQQRDALAAQVQQLTQEKTQIERQIEQSEAENKQLKEQVQVLATLPKKGRLDMLNRLVSVKVGSYTGFYDKNHDGIKEKLIVYIQPVDQQGDKIKAAGDVDVQLWDLSKTEGGALLGRWHVSWQQLKKLWFDTLMTTNYRLMFDTPKQIDPEMLAHDSMTVKITFTDYLSGRTFTDQKAIKPTPP
jgi:outer membrane murein-binding lipoprotein Lpp